MLADIVDRRALLLVVQGGLVLASAGLAVLTFAGMASAGLLLAFTFLIGSATVFSVPAYQALIPDLVPRPEIRGASGLSSININLGRLVGPAAAGLLIARIGVGGVFALNTALFLVLALVVAGWWRRIPVDTENSERFVAAMAAGIRYVSHASYVRRVMFRAALFLLPGTALWALLPLVATQRLGQGAAGYGLLLAALGAGAIAGALVLPRVRASLSDNGLLAVAGSVYAVVLVVLVLIRIPALVLLILVPAGMAWLAVLTTTNATLQLMLPAWVRARGLSVYQMVLFGSQAVGAAVWGVVAAPLGLVTTFVIAGAVMLAGVLTIRLWPLLHLPATERGLTVYWPDPRLVVDLEPSTGPIIVTQTYTIAPDREEQFLGAMRHVRESRRRTGAMDWELLRDAEHAHVFLELFTVPSWDEHLRQHYERQTGTDRRFLEEAEALSNPPPTTSHLVGIALPRGELSS